MIKKSMFLYLQSNKILCFDFHLPVVYYVCKQEIPFSVVIIMIKNICIKKKIYIYIYMCVITKTSRVAFVRNSFFDKRYTH